MKNNYLILCIFYLFLQPNLVSGCAIDCNNLDQQKIQSFSKAKFRQAVFLNTAKPLPANKAPRLMKLSVQVVKVWPHGILPIKLHSAFANHRDRVRVFSACRWWSKNTQIRCVKYNSTKHQDYVLVVPAKVNRSYIGRAGGEQLLELASLKVKGTIVHEFGHALGFAHQHNSPLRDNYIKIVHENIKHQGKYEFIKAKVFVGLAHYDFCSIMHYKLADFSANGKNTIKIIGKKPSCKIGQRDHLSKLDIERAQALYGKRLLLGQR